MTLDVNVNGTDHKQNFTTVAAANAFFRNKASPVCQRPTNSAKAGYDCTVLEARDGVGGRNWSIRRGTRLPTARANFAISTPSFTGTPVRREFRAHMRRRSGIAANSALPSK
jgi:hypothetical protein